MMCKGKLLDDGMTAEVYEWGKDKVIKLFYDGFSDDWINNEAIIGKAVHEIGIASPAVFEIINVGSRKGIVLERIFGNTMLRHIQAEPWKLYYYTRELAGLHFKIHQFASPEGIPSQKERFIGKINMSSEILGDRIKAILRYIENLPDGSSVCHGDFHFDNIFVTENGLVPIDWSNAYIGNPLGDVARTCLMINSPAVQPDASDIMMPLFQYTKWSIYWTYLNEYRKHTRIDLNSIDAWTIPAAAVKIADKIPGEEKWLMGIIDKHLDKL
jgi:uncharacterized protein (TIGR02172 family)